MAASDRLGIAGMLGMLVFCALVIGAVVWVIREVSGRREGRAGAEQAKALLDRRLTAREISIEEYRQRKTVLRGEVATPSDVDPSSRRRPRSALRRPPRSAEDWIPLDIALGSHHRPSPR
jgi:hypothetical protein